MMKSTSTFICISFRMCLLGMAMISLPLYGQNFKEIHVDRGKELNHSYFSFHKNVMIEGVIHGNLFCFMGNVSVKGTVEGDVTVVFGNLELDGLAKVGGQIVTVGTPYIGPQVPMEKRYDLPLKKAFFPQGFSFFEQLKRSLARVLMGFFLACLMIYVKPGLIRETGLEIRTDWMPVFFAGALLIILFLGLLLGSFLIFSNPVGPVLFFFFSLVLFCFSAFGLVGVFETLAHYIAKTLDPKWNYIHSLFLGVLLFEVLSVLPVIGIVIQWVALILGVGATLSTRFGTNKGWFTRKKKVWLGKTP